MLCTRRHKWLDKGDLLVVYNRDRPTPGRRTQPSRYISLKSRGETNMERSNATVPESSGLRDFTPGELT